MQPHRSRNCALTIAPFSILANCTRLPVWGHVPATKVRHSAKPFASASTPFLPYVALLSPQPPCSAFSSRPAPQSQHPADRRRTSLPSAVEKALVRLPLCSPSLQCCSASGGPSAAAIISICLHSVLASSLRSIGAEKKGASGYVN